MEILDFMCVSFIGKSRLMYRPINSTRNSFQFINYNLSTIKNMLPAFSYLGPELLGKTQTIFFEVVIDDKNGNLLAHMYG